MQRTCPRAACRPAAMIVALGLVTAVAGGCDRLLPFAKTADSGAPRFDSSSRDVSVRDGRPAEASGQDLGCPPGTHRCLLDCVSDSDPNHCGDSCAPCAVGDPLTTEPTCVQDPASKIWSCGPAKCKSGYCVPPTLPPVLTCVPNTLVTGCGPNCTVCPAQTFPKIAACQNSACGFGCATGYSTCTGQCVDLTSSAQNCGTCGYNCAALPHVASGAGCAASTCSYTCATGYADLDGDKKNGCESTLPTGVPEASGLVLWLAGEDWNGTTWPDRSLGKRNATWYFAKPGTAQLNSKNVVVFPGPPSGGELLINAGFPKWNGATVMVVANTSVDDFVISMGVSFNIYSFCAYDPPRNKPPGCVNYDQFGFGAAMNLQQCDPLLGSCYQTYGPPVAGGKWVRSTAWENPATNPSFYTFFDGVSNGVLASNVTYPHPPPWDTPRIDTIVGWRNYKGQVAEIIVFNVPLSDPSRLALDAYLKRKWGL